MAAQRATYFHALIVRPGGTSFWTISVVGRLAGDLTIKCFDGMCTVASDDSDLLPITFYSCVALTSALKRLLFEHGS
jgi:hypothetical protein